MQWKGNIVHSLNGHWAFPTTIFTLGSVFEYFNKETKGCRLSKNVLQFKTTKDVCMLLQNIVLCFKDLNKINNIIINKKHFILFTFTPFTHNHIINKVSSVFRCQYFALKYTHITCIIYKNDCISFLINSILSCCLFL